MIFYHVNRNLNSTSCSHEIHKGGTMCTQMSAVPFLVTNPVTRAEVLLAGMDKVQEFCLEECHPCKVSICENCLADL